MRMLIGGTAQGKRALVLARGFSPARICDGATHPNDTLPDLPVLDRLHLLVRRQLESGIDPLSYAARLAKERPELLVIVDELGGGIVPIDRFEREWRETVGRVCCLLAERCERVERVIAGIPQTLKGCGKLQISLIRHGQTAGNLARRYIGSTDEPLTEATMAGFCNMAYPVAEAVFVSPMLRCRQTAEQLYPALTPIVLPELRECDFGAFEGKSHTELADDPAYRRWIAANGQCDPPGGEPVQTFKDRCCTAFAQLVRRSLQGGTKRLALVTHGGVIMALLERHARPAQLFYEWQTPNLGGYRLALDEADWEDARILRVTDTIQPGGTLICFTPSRS